MTPPVPDVSPQTTGIGEGPMCVMEGKVLLPLAKGMLNYSSRPAGTGPGLRGWIRQEGGSSFFSEPLDPTLST